MNFSVITAPQRSEAWFQARLGCLTASCAADMLANIKSGEAAARTNLRVQLVCERLTQQPQDDGYVSPDMQRGIDLEPYALAAYESLTGNVASAVGFCKHLVYAAGCSPDGVVDDFAGVVELKCPKAATHWSYLRGETAVPARYRPQLMHTLWITGADYADFLSFHPAFPLHLRTFYVRLRRQQAEVDAYAAKALAFLDEVEREVSVAKGWSVLAEEQKSA